VTATAITMFDRTLQSFTVRKHRACAMLASSISCCSTIRVHRDAAASELTLCAADDHSDYTALCTAVRHQTAALLLYVLQYSANLISDRKGLLRQYEYPEQM
jgi:hypothetical protein